MVTCCSFLPFYALSMFPFLLLCLCKEEQGRVLPPYQWDGFCFCPFIASLVPCPLCLLMLHLCSLSCCSIVQKGAVRNVSPRHRHLHSFQISSEHPLLSSPPFVFCSFSPSYALVVFPFLVVVMFEQGGMRRSGEEHCPRPPPLLGFMFQNENETWNIKIIHETQNMKCETLRITSSLVCLFSLHVFLLPLALFCCVGKNNKECRPPPLPIFIFVPFRWAMNIVLSPPLVCCSFVPSCALSTLPLLLLLCLCKEERRGVLPRPCSHCWVIVSSSSFCHWFGSLPFAPSYSFSCCFVVQRGLTRSTNPHRH